MLDKTKLGFINAFEVLCPPTFDFSTLYQQASYIGN